MAPFVFVGSVEISPRITRCFVICFPEAMATSDTTDCLPFLRALSDESRWEIVRLLIASPGTKHLGEIAERLGISNYNASKHVRILKEAGILQVERNGRFKEISIVPAFLKRIRFRSTSGILDLGCCRFDFK